MADLSIKEFFLEMSGIGSDDNSGSTEGSPTVISTGCSLTDEGSGLWTVTAGTPGDFDVTSDNDTARIKATTGTTDLLVVIENLVADSFQFHSDSALLFEGAPPNAADTVTAVIGGSFGAASSLDAAAQIVKWVAVMVPEWIVNKTNARLNVKYNSTAYDLVDPVTMTTAGQILNVLSLEGYYDIPGDLGVFGSLDRRPTLDGTGETYTVTTGSRSHWALGSFIGIGGSIATFRCNNAGSYAFNLKASGGGYGFYDVYDGRLIMNCESTSNTTGGIYCGTISRSGLVQGCRVYNEVIGIKAVGNDSISREAIYRDNIITDCVTGITVVGGHYASFIGNLFYHNKMGLSVVSAIIHNLYNNVFVQASDAGASDYNLKLAGNPIGVPGFLVGYNSYTEGGSGSNCDTTIPGLSTSIFDAVLFVDADNDDYQTADDSPAINAGGPTKVPNIPWGLTVNTPDIGFQHMETGGSVIVIED